MRKKHGVEFFESAVGEVNVVKTMKEQKAAIGGEGNGGIIYPELHYGRDALVGSGTGPNASGNFKKDNIGTKSTVCRL